MCNFFGFGGLLKLTGLLCFCLLQGCGGEDSSSPGSGKTTTDSCSKLNYKEKTFVIAIADGDTKHVECLIERGLDVNQREEGQWYSPLCHTILRDHPPLVTLFINKGAVVGDTCDPKGSMPPIHLAAATASSKVLEALIEGGADVNQRGEKRRTPLMKAAYYGKYDNVALLISRGAGVCARAGEGNNITAYNLARSQGHHRTAGYLLSRVNCDSGYPIN